MFTTRSWNVINILKHGVYQNNSSRASKFSVGEVPQRLLCAARLKITVSGIPNLLNYFVRFTEYKNVQMWPLAA